MLIKNPKPTKDHGKNPANDKMKNRDNCKRAINGMNLKIGLIFSSSDLEKKLKRSFKFSS
jgi:hypothetical protein